MMYVLEYLVYHLKPYGYGQIYTKVQQCDGSSSENKKSETLVNSINKEALISKRNEEELKKDENIVSSSPNGDIKTNKNINSINSKNLPTKENKILQSLGSAKR